MSVPPSPPWSKAALIYDDALPMKLGCTLCPDLDVCGGLRAAAPVFDCRMLCACQRQGMRCSGVCRRDPRVFIKRLRDVDGLEFDSVPRCRALRTKPILDYVPIIYDGTNRSDALDSGTVALPLMSMFNRRSSTGRFESRKELLAHFRLAQRTPVILTGVAQDPALERWWSFSNRQRLIESLTDLRIEVVTTPNYSLALDVTRHDNLQNMKRIALTFAEFMAGGIPCALHLNARTNRDYERWTDFVGERDEVRLVAFEFTTGTAGRRGTWHRDQLIALATDVARPLHLFIRGGRQHLRQLAGVFASITILDGAPYVRTKYRRRARFAINGGIDWYPSWTMPGEALDELLQHNIEFARYSARLETRRRLRADYSYAKAGDMSPLLQTRSA